MEDEEMERPLNAKEAREFIEALERQGFHWGLAKFVWQHKNIAKKVVKMVEKELLKDLSIGGF